jgi:hypothetical protein
MMNNGILCTVKKLSMSNMPESSQRYCAAIPIRQRKPVNPWLPSQQVFPMINTEEEKNRTAASGFYVKKFSTTQVL